GNYRSGPSATTRCAQDHRWTPWSPCLSRGGDPGRTARAHFLPWMAGSSPAMTWKKTLARDFPRRFDFASFLVLRVLQRDAHFAKLVADAVAFREVLAFAGFETGGDLFVDDMPHRLVNRMIKRLVLFEKSLMLFKP